MIAKFNLFKSIVVMYAIRFDNQVCGRRRAPLSSRHVFITGLVLSYQRIDKQFRTSIQQIVSTVLRDLVKVLFLNARYHSDAVHGIAAVRTLHPSELNSELESESGIHWPCIHSFPKSCGSYKPPSHIPLQNICGQTSDSTGSGDSVSGSSSGKRPKAWSSKRSLKCLRRMKVKNFRIPGG